MTPEELYESNEKLVYSAMYKHFPDLVHDEDMLQEARLAFWEACCNYDPSRGKLSTYAYVRIRTRILHLLRMEKAKKRMGEVLYLSEPLADRDDVGVLEDVIVGEADVNWHDWESFSKGLSVRDREILRMYCAGYKQCDIATKYNTTKANVSRIVRKASHGLRKYL